MAKKKEESNATTAAADVAAEASADIAADIIADIAADSTVERHPWEPFIPADAKVLVLGTFPPGRHRWSMEFYYPNRTNDFWFMMGLLFGGDRDALYDRAAGRFRLPQIKELLTRLGVAVFDTAVAVRRLRSNASDKFLEILEPLPLQKLLERMPRCRTIVTTGQKAASVISVLTDTPVPAQGRSVTWHADGGDIAIWRMPSTSRAYPMPLQTKADAYAVMFRSLGMLP